MSASCAVRWPHALYARRPAAAPCEGLGARRPDQAAPAAANAESPPPPQISTGMEGDVKWSSLSGSTYDFVTIHIVSGAVSEKARLACTL